MNYTTECELSEEELAMNGEPRTYDVVVVKKGTGEEIRGTMKDDGLASLYAVHPHDGGEVRYVTVLDTFIKKVEVTK